VHFLGRNSYIYWRIFKNLDLSAEDYVKKFRVFKNFKISEGYYELTTYVLSSIVKGYGNCPWGNCKWGIYIANWNYCPWSDSLWGG